MTAWPVKEVGDVSITAADSPSGNPTAGARAAAILKRPMAAKIAGFARMDRMAPARMRSRPRSGNKPRSTPRLARMKENSPICARLAAIISAVPTGMPEGDDDGEGGDRLADQDDGQHREHRPGLLHQNKRIEQDTDGNEEQHRKGVAQRQGLLRRLMAELGLAQHHAGEEGAEGKGDVEDLRCAIGDAESDRQHRQDGTVRAIPCGRHSGGSRGSPGGRPPASARQRPRLSPRSSRAQARYRKRPAARLPQRCRFHREGRPAPAAAPEPEPSPDPRRSASRRRCAHVRCR